VDTLVGKVTHYYDKLGVAIVKIDSDKLALGNTIKFDGPQPEFAQIVDSMQLNHQNIAEATTGAEVGIKVEQPVKENTKVYLVS